MFKEAIVINLFGQPSAGKSTMAAQIFSELKMREVDCELATEFVKSKVWSEDKETFNNQLYIIGNQSFKITRCLHKVDVIISDSPILLSMYYNTDEKLQNIGFDDFILNYFNQFKNMNYLLYPTRRYNQNGRLQTEEEANKIGLDLEALLHESEIPYRSIDGNREGGNQVVKEVLQQLNGEHQYFTFS